MPKPAFPSAVWTECIRASADPDRAGRMLKLLAETPARPTLAGAGATQARLLCALFSGSQAWGELLLAQPERLAELREENLRAPRRGQGLRGELQQTLVPLLQGREHAAALAAIRRFKQREMLRIAARDLARLGSTEEIILEISEVADTVLAAVLEVCRRDLAERAGQPHHQEADGRWRPTPFCVLGLGKLGGQELNYSSDVDVMFVYGEEGRAFKGVPGGRAHAPLSSHQFFTRLAEAFVAEVGRLSPEGMLYRIDLRLRPEGETGPLVRSLAGFENYYAQWGQTWERMMLIKARGVAGDVSLAGEFLEMVQSFRYPRSLTRHALAEMAAMKQRIEEEVVRSGELDRNVKLGRGGIREIEFTVQALQMLHGGRNPFLHGSQTLPLLDKLAQYKLLEAEEALALRRAYLFLREVEHRLQMDQDRQTHTIPLETGARARLARLMGRQNWPQFEAERAGHARHVRATYDRLLKTESPTPASLLPREFEESEAAWKQLLPARSFRDAEKAFRLLREFVLGPGYGHISARTTELAWRLIPKLIALCPLQAPQASTLTPEEESLLGTDRAPVRLSDPDRVLARLDTFISAYGARSTLYEVWANNPSLFELLLLLFDRSEFLAETAIRTPDMVEELMLSGHLRRHKTAAEIFKELQFGLGDEDQKLWLRRYHKSEFMRIGLRHILGLADCEKNLVELSALADACLQYALEIVMRRRKLKKAPLVIIGLGKLGGCEIDYGSDLDIVFVVPSAVRGLAALQRLAVEIMELLSSPTELGVAFHLDARLRPDGEKGLLVNTLEAYETYYRRRAMLWEIQALTRLRPVAGDLLLGSQFLRMTAGLTNFTPANVAAGFPVVCEHAATSAQARARARLAGRAKRGPGGQAGLACHTTDWKQQVHKMRLRIEKERTPPGKNALAFKTGTGGLIDAEFIAQALCLEHGWQEANTLRVLERAQAAGVLGGPVATRLIENYRQLRRMEAILRRWSYEGEALLPDDPAPMYRVAVRCGWRSAEEFTRAVAGYRAALREGYVQFFSAGVSM
jgi:[glutamine synthetase] adenylyltransferase / [glutamine synthetase]-adenylyl-L-tyrosine phosphorylase